MKTMQSYAFFSPIDLAQSSLEPQVLMKEEAGMALLWRDLEAHSVAGFVHRLQLELHPQLFIISSDHVGDIFWRQVDQVSIFDNFCKVTTRLAITAVVSSINIELLQRLWMSMANHPSACGRIIMDYPLISPTD